MAISTGADVLVSDTGRLGSDRIGLVTNQTGVTNDLTYTRVALLDKGVGLQRLFSPEHGIWGIAKAGDPVDDKTDDLTNCPIYSLFGTRQAPDTELLGDLDALLFDVQDIGVRCWTYTASMVACMRATVDTDCRFIVLDRPNPLGGAPLEGNVMPEEWSSFVGLQGIPLLYGLTIGELATYMNEELGIGADLEVVELEGWTRDSWYDQTGLPWVPSIPQLACLQQALIYPSTVLLEGTNVTPGWGTGRGPMLAGAPWIDRGRTLELAYERLEAAGLTGVRFRADRFRPREGVISGYPGTECTGVQIHITDRDTFQPLQTGLVLLSAIHDVHDEFEWVTRDTELGQRYWTDVLAGTQEYRTLISEEAPIEDVLSITDCGIEVFRSDRKPYLRY